MGGWVLRLAIVILNITLPLHPQGTVLQLHALQTVRLVVPSPIIVSPAQMEEIILLPVCAQE